MANSLTNIVKYGSRTIHKKVVDNKIKYVPTDLDGCVLYLPMEEKTINLSLDQSGHNNHGTIYGAPEAAGKIGKALRFDGIDDYVNCGSHESLNITDAFTIIAWVKRINKNNFERILSHSIDSSTYAFEVGTDLISPTMWRLRLNSDAVTLLATMLGDADEWVHIAYTYDKDLNSDNMKIYENGVLLSFCDYNESLTNHGTLMTNRFGKNDGWLNSTIDEVRIYNRALNQEEIKACYEQEK